MTSNVDIIDTAKGYIGKLKYDFGSDNIAGGSGDCSSFTEYVFAVHGLHIGADTSAQYSQGKPISRDDIKAGDLVFFKDTWDSKKIDGVSHVGIATSNDTFIHLSSSGCKRSSLNEPYWKEHYLDTRRVSGVTYEDFSDTTTDTENTETTEEKTDLIWWGDIVRVVVIFLLIISAVIFLGVGFGKNIVNKGGLINES